MSFPPYNLPSNWLSVVSTYHAYAYGIPDSALPYSFTGDISANSSAQWNAVTWTDVRPQPTYAALSDPAFQQEAISSMGGYLSTFNQIADHAQITANTSAISGNTGSISSLAGTVSTMSTSLTAVVSGQSSDAGSITTLNTQMSAANAKFGRTTSAFSLSTSGTGATGTQVSSTKDSTVHLNLSNSTTSTIGGPSISDITIKTCATNSATESDWATVADIDNEQTVTLAIALQSIQLIKELVTVDMPAGSYIKAVASGSGTHTESVLRGQKTIYNG